MGAIKMREPDGTMFVIGVLIVAAITIAAIGLGWEAYLTWYIKN